MVPLTADSVCCFILILSPGKSLLSTVAMHYVLYCSKVSTHATIYPKKSVAGKTGKKRSCHTIHTHCLG